MSKRRRVTYPKLVQFYNCFLLRDHAIVPDDLWIRDGVILDPHVVFFEENVAADIKIDCKGLLIAPGYIDVQINGGFGVDFSSDTGNIKNNMEIVCTGLLQHGVTSFCPTIVTSSRETYHQLISQIQSMVDNCRGSTILGMHLEGPFINKEKRGAHEEMLIEALDSRGIEKMIDYYSSLDCVKIITIAPELPFALDTIKALKNRGIIVSIGHTMSSLNIAEDAVGRGARFITHLFNAMLPFHHRDPGVVGLLTSDSIPEPIYFGIIADGIHTHPTALRIAHRTHPEGLVLVSDAIAAMGLPPGRHNLGTVKVDIDHERATLLGSETLAGSIAPIDFCVRQFRKLAGCTKVEALEAASLHPAKLLTISDHKGTLNYNADADIIVLNDELEVQATFIAGNLMWLNNNSPLTREIFANYGTQ